MHKHLAGTRGPLEERINTISETLISRFRKLVDALPEGPYRPQELARVLGVKKDVSSRLLRALRQPDALAGTHVLPGPESLRLVVRAAAKRGADAEQVRAAEEAVRDFELLLRNDVGDRAGLDAVIGSLLPDARERFEMAAKQAQYRGFACLKGVVTDAAMVAFVVHPAAHDSASRLDTVMVGLLRGLRRLRPGAPVRFTSVLQRRTGRAFLGRDPNGEQEGPLLPQFTSPWPLPAERVVRNDRVIHELGDRGVGPRSAVDIALAEYYPSNHPRFQDPAAPQKRWFYATVEQPAKVFLMDVLVHVDVWKDSDPELRLYDTTVNGTVDPNDPAAEDARLDLAEAVRPLGRGVQRFRVGEIKNYVEALSYVCTAMGWDPNAFRGYRCRIPYAAYGSQICMLFDPPRAE